MGGCSSTRSTGFHPDIFGGYPVESSHRTSNTRNVLGSVWTGLAEMSAKVFISYRRGTGSGYALLLYDRLRARLPDVFHDRNCIGAGEKFPEKIEEWIANSDAMIVVISDGWAKEFENHRREHPSEPDYVLLEIREALKHDKEIIPVTVGGASFEGLPKDLADVDDKLRARFGIRNAEPLEDDKFDQGVEELVEKLWRPPPAAYWASAVLGLMAAAVLGLWAVDLDLARVLAAVRADSCLVRRPFHRIGRPQEWPQGSQRHWAAAGYREFADRLVARVGPGRGRIVSSADHTNNRSAMRSYLRGLELRNAPRGRDKASRGDRAERRGATMVLGVAMERRPEGRD